MQQFIKHQQYLTLFYLQHPFGGGKGPKLTSAAIEKQKEAEEISNNHHKNKLKINIIENSPLKNSTSPVKYTVGLKNVNSSNCKSKNSGKILDSGGINLGYIDDECNSHLQTNIKSSDSRNEDKR